MKTHLSLLIFLFAFLNAFGWAQGSGVVDHIYQQQESALAEGMNNNYPYMVLAGDERRFWVQPIFETNPTTNYTYDGQNLTLTLDSGTTTAVYQDHLRIRNFGGTTFLCQVASATSTTITLDTRFCQGMNGTWNQPGGSNAGMYYEIIDGPNRDATGTWSVIDTSSDTSTTETYFLEDATKSRNTGGTGCDPDLHSASCYTTNPSLSNAPSFGVYVHIGPVQGDCSQQGSIQTHDLELVSTKSFTLRFASTVDPTKTSDIHVLICKNGAGHDVGYSHPSPGYRQAFTNQTIPVWNINFGTTDQYTVYTMTSDDGEGDATLQTFDPPAGETFVQNGGKLPVALLHTGTKTDGYHIWACPDESPSTQAACGWIRIYVVAGSPPESNPDKVEAAPCVADPVMTAAGGQVYDFGPGQTYADPQALPESVPWGSTFRYHGESGTAGNPVVFHEYWQLKIPTNAADMTSTTTVPAYYTCGIPDAAGEYPRIDGQDATGNADIDPNIAQGRLYTIIGIASNLPQFDTYTGHIQQLHHVGVSNIVFLNDTAGISYYTPGQPVGGTTSTYLDGNAVRFYSTEQYAVIGVRAINVANPFLSDCSSNHGWQRNCNPYSYYEGNHLEGYGISGRPTEHPIYLEDIGAIFVGNLEDGAATGSQGTACFSFRSNRAIYMYNRCVILDPYNGASGVGGAGEVQDNSNYVEPNAAFGPTAGWDGTTCSNGDTNYPFCTYSGNDGPPAFGGVNTFAAFQENHYFSFFTGGNAFHMNSGNCGTGISFTNSDNSLTDQHNQYFYNNISACDYTGAALFQDVRIGSISGNTNIAQPFDWAHMFAYNNILWWADNSNCSYGSCSPAQSTPTAQINFAMNLVKPGQFSYATNIGTQFGQASGINQSGLNQGVGYNDYGGHFYAERQIGGWSASNFVTSTTQPYDNTTLVPFLASAAEGKAVVLPYPMRLYPILYNAVDANNTLTLRTDATTLGPYDAAGGPTLASITVSPAGPLTLKYPATVQLTATCNFSDGTSGTCESATWASDSDSCTVSSAGLVSTTTTAGICNVTATQTGVSSDPVVITVLEPPPPFVRLGAGARISGNVRIQ